MKMKLRALAAAMVLAGLLGGIALFVSSVLVALAVTVPILVVIAVLFGKPVQRDDR